ncbi:LysE/ArgO family amino acid transporter [Demequina sediminicola]|uniref:LysE/ArgO family amino acid transporter n=1 Tax=Demequina sediminicola TaxID=1095026 RepID=UPI000781E794|nr:LysE/ArgO family amino acid transporter [Demequina sediminicola]
MTFFVGLGLGLSLIAAVGAQNVFVLRQGIRREHVVAVVLVCALSDAVLIAAGTAGLGAIIGAHSWIETVARIGGAVFLATYAVMAAMRAMKGPDNGLDVSTAPSAGPTIWAVALTTFAITWLNPHVYLDTVVLLGTVAATYGAEKWLFAFGAMTGSLLWFTVLGYGARLLSGVLASPRAWVIVDWLVAAMMALLAVLLILGL